MTQKIQGVGALQKLFAVMNDMGWVEKNAQISMGGGSYSYATETDMLIELIPLFKKHKLVVIPTNVDDYKLTEKRVTKKDIESVSYLTEIKMTYRFYDVETGDYVECQVMSQGMDSTDKGVFKALTNALKYVLRQSTLMGTGEDVEKTDENNNQVAVQKPTHVIDAVKIIFKQSNLNFDDFNDVWKRHNINTSTEQEVTDELKAICRKMAKVAADIKSGISREDAVKAFERDMKK